MCNWQRDKLEGVLPKKDALDYCILQKVLPKIQGQGELLREVLTKLAEWLEGKTVSGVEAGPGFSRSLGKIERMIRACFKNTSEA